jgi:hypothetical protein
MRISVSIETPNAFSMRSAISGDNAARSFSRADSAGRVTPNALAASVTDSSGASTISLFTNPPGCAGFFTRTPVLPSRQPPERRTCEYHFFIFVMHFTQQLVVSADSTIESGFPSSERWVSYPPHSLRKARLSQGD